MRTRHCLFKLAVVVLCGAALLAPGDISWGDGEFYVVGGGSPWKRNGTNIYYNAGAVSIGIETADNYSLNVLGELHGANGGGNPGVSGYNYGGGCGVYGWSYNGFAVVAQVYDKTAGYAVYCDGNFECTGSSTVLGIKSAAVATSQGDRKLYSQESPEVWFEDFGEGQLRGGTAKIDLDPLFLETVTINEQQPMKVFIQLNDDCRGVYVQRQATGFEVVELAGGKSSAHFTYRVVAKRKGFETARLEAAPYTPKMAALKGPTALAALQP